MALVSESQGLATGPRWINANFPFSELAGRAEQAVPGSPSVVTSTSGAVSPGEALTGPKKQSWLTGSHPKQSSLRSAVIVCKLAGALDPITLTRVPSACEFKVAPTPITEGAVAGEAIELK